LAFITEAECLQRGTNRVLSITLIRFVRKGIMLIYQYHITVSRCEMYKSSATRQ